MCFSVKSYLKYFLSGHIYTCCVIISRYCCIFSSQMIGILSKVCTIRVPHCQLHMPNQELEIIILLVLIKLTKNPSNYSVLDIVCEFILEFCNKVGHKHITFHLVYLCESRTLTISRTLTVSKIMNLRLRSESHFPISSEG